MDPPPGQPGSCVASPSCQALQLSAGESGDLNSWLSHSGALKAALQRLHTEPEGPLVLQVDMAAELACFPGLMAALLLQPDAVHLAVLDKVTQLQPQISRLQRVWIRLIAVPLPLLTVPELHQQVRTSGVSLPQPVHFTGICAAATTIGQQVWARQLICSHCGAETAALEGVPLVACCTEASWRPAYEEDLSARVLVPVQQLWIQPLSTACGSSGPSAHQPLHHRVLVQVLDEDLCGSMHVGDCVTVYGHASMPARGTGARCGASLQVKANNIVRIPAHQLASSLYTPAQQQDWHCTIGKQPDLLSSLCDALQACVERPLQQDTLLALLLSAVSAGHASPAATTASTASAFTSQQVHLLVLSEGSDASLQRVLQEAASLLAPHSLLHTHAGALLPSCSAFGLDGSAEQALKVEAGTLGLACQGMVAEFGQQRLTAVHQ